jgi:hypothetical protein
MIWALLAIVALALFVASWLLGTPAGQDRLATKIALDMLEVERVVGADPASSRCRELFVYRVRVADLDHVVLAPSQQQAALAMMPEDPAEDAAVVADCLLGLRRIIPRGDRRWAVAALPDWASFMGRRGCEHGMSHELSYEPSDPLEVALLTSADPRSPGLEAALLDATLFIVGFEFVEDAQGPRVRLQALELGGRSVIAAFSSQALTAVLPQNLRAAPVSMRVFLEVYPADADLPMLINGGLPSAFELTSTRLHELRDHLSG